MKFGAIDIGTNAARLLIGEIETVNGHENVKKISYTRIPLRLGYDVFENGLISPTKEVEFIKTIKAFKLLSEVFGVKKLRACATSAMREAKNAKEIKEKIKLETDVNIEIINGRQEGALIMSSFELLHFDRTNPFLVIDVGGGSTEISMYKKNKKQNSKSFKIGTIRLLKQKVPKDIWKQIEKWIFENIELNEQVTIFATGGNINNVHKLMGLQYMEPIQTVALAEMKKDMDALTKQERIEIYNLKEDRADVIIPALEIYSRILELLKVDSIFVPKIGLSDGIIYNLHKKFSNK